MSDMSGIEWTRSTWNPTVGCSLMSPGCTHCYAMKLAHSLATRFKNAAGQKYIGLTKKASSGDPVWTGVVRLSEEALPIPLQWRKPRLVFVNSMSDLFHESLPVSAVDRVFAVMGLAGQHIFQLLTKRPDRMRDYLNDPKTEERVRLQAEMMALHLNVNARIGAWPLRNVWCGTSVEDQRRADERIPQLLDVKAHTRFLSIEPLLSAVVLTKAAPRKALSKGIHWIIVGGESGRKARPMHPLWAGSLRDECLKFGIPFFFKQWGQWSTERHGKKVKSIGLTPDGLQVEPGTKGAVALWSVGKKLAGKRLDNKVYQDYPEDGRAIALKSRLTAKSLPGRAAHPG